jgi:LuxR family maltose regulon positive regulatory protein
MSAAGPPGTVALSVPIVESKLVPPRARPGVVPRRRLFAALDAHDETELTLVSAPAGFGKTTLLGSWLASRDDVSTAWVSLDPGDADPLRFWSYVALAVDRVRPGIAKPALTRLQTPAMPLESSVEELLNGLATFAGKLVIALDDLHHLSPDDRSTGFSRAVEHLPPQVRIVATTRADPAIGSARLRARGALSELRARDLAFTRHEARRLLVDSVGLRLHDVEVALLVERTEGWAAGLSLVGLWLGAEDDPSARVMEFSGDQRHVADYLTTEVLDALDDEMRCFVLRTSILDRFCAALCDTALETTESARLLAELERSNLFLVPLDGRGEWYRYHHLFRDLLRMELAHQGIETAPFHRRAASWFAASDLYEEALDHLAAAGDESAVADLLATSHRALLRSGQLDLLLTWTETLSEQSLARVPEVPAAAALAAVGVGSPRELRRRLTAAAASGATQLAQADGDYVRAVLALAGVICLDEDLGAAVEQGRLAASGDPSHEATVAGMAFLAYALYLRGDLDGAGRLVDQALARPDAPRRPHGRVVAEAVRALVDCELGRPHAAEPQARVALVRARELGFSDLLSAGIAHLALGCALLELGKTQEAERELERAEFVRRTTEPRLGSIHTLVVLAAARIARGRLTLAAAELAVAREQLTAFADAGRLPTMLARVESALASALGGAEHPVEPPTPAELAVLRLLATDLSQREIGSRLFLSVNTVKTHSRNLYRKLGASSREDAVRRAEAVGLLADAESPG